MAAENSIQNVIDVSVKHVFFLCDFFIGYDSDVLPACVCVRMRVITFSSGFPTNL